MSKHRHTRVSALALLATLAAAPAAAQDVMIQAIWDVSFCWSWGEIPSSYLEIGSFVSGGETFAGMLEQAATAMDEHIAYGDWDPAADAEGATLYARRDELIDGLAGEALRDPSDWVELRIYVDMCECSEEAVGLIQLSTGAVLVVHENAHC